MKRFIAQIFLNLAYDLSKKNNNIAIIGGGDGGVARACLK